MVRRSVRFSTQVLLFQLGILALVCAAGFGLMALLLRQDLIDQYEQRALVTARSVAADGRYADSVAASDPGRGVQTWAEAVRRRTGALFVVVTDARGIRFSHPDTALLGKPVAVDQAQSLGGHEVTTFGSSAAGRSARAKVPLWGRSGNVVGEVIVAISAKDLDAHLFKLLLGAAGFLGIALGFGAAGAIALTRRVKRQTLGLEPAGLRLLFEQQAALRRVATLVARGVPPTEVFDAVTAEVASLLGARSTSLLHYETDGTSTLVAVRSDPGITIAVGSRLALENDDIAALVLSSGRAARRAVTQRPTSQVGELELCSTIGAPVMVEGSLWGVMIAGWTEQVKVSAETEKRLADFTDLVATAIANANSRAELTESRARVVAAADETRRRIERDLHDGTQQRLVSLGLELRTAETAVPAELTELGDQLSHAAESIGEIVAGLQEVSRGIHPAILSKGGLGPALRALGRRSAVPLELDVRGDRRLPVRVEVAVYYVVSEALTNSAKHAHASVVHVDLAAADSVVHLRVHDDGKGGADPANGSGLLGLRDRVEAVGGKLDIMSIIGKGTTLRATIPFEESSGVEAR
jgi:signal transduction histidine kinase